MLHQYNFSIQFQPSESLLDRDVLSGCRSDGISRSLFINVNQVPFEYALDGRNTQRNRPYPMINGTVIPTYSTAKSNYNAFNLRVEQRYRAGLSFLLQLHHPEEPRRRRLGTERIYTERRHLHRAGHVQSVAREGARAHRRAADLFPQHGYELPWGPGKTMAEFELARFALDRRLAGQRHHNPARRLPDGHPNQPDCRHLQYIQRT